MSRAFHRDVVVSRPPHKDAQGSTFARAPWVLAALLTSSCGSCITPTSIANSVAGGTARLTVRNLTSVATIINNDTHCGFASPAVLGAPTINGTIGSRGSMTWTVTDCEFDGGDGTVFSTSCEGVTKTASGKFRISATKTVTGTLTGVPTSPLIPDGPNAFSAALTSLEFTDFKVVASDSESWLNIKSGKATGKLERLLSVLASNGVCGFATDNTKLSDLVVSDAKMHVSTATSEVEVDLTEAKINAYAGQFFDHENEIAGELTLSSQVTLKKPLPSPPLIPSGKKTITLPVAGDDNKLDPSYEHDKFISSYSCDPTMLKPQSYTCADLTPSLADGAARLTVKTFGTIAGLVDKADCGFGSANAHVTPSVAPGNIGTLTLELTTPCSITLPADTLLPADCSGAQTKVGGHITVTGSKVVSGRFTGNSASPVIPMTDSPATITLNITFDNFKVGTAGSTTALNGVSGTLSGSIQPRVALADDTFACSVTTSMARFNALTWSTAKVQVISSSGTIDLPIASSAINATNGTWGADSNALSGTVTVASMPYTVPSDAHGLDPTFTQAAFDASWTCAPHLIMPVNHTCAFVLPLAQGVARLTPRTVGAVLSLVNGDTTCGFSAIPGATSHLDAAPIAGGLGEPNSQLRLTIPETNKCTVTIPATQTPDCAGVTSTPTGTVRVWGTKTITGFLTGDQSPGGSPIVPTTWEPAVFDLHMELVDFKVVSSASTSNLTFTDGTLHAVVTPRTAIDKANGACSKSTPIVHFEPMAVTTAAHVVLNNGGNLFNLALGTTTSLTAQSGNASTTLTNKLTGNVSLDGVELAIPVTGADDKLDPAYDQAAFDASYQCAAANLVPAPASAACSFRRSLAMGVARLLIKDVATATSVLNSSSLAAAIPCGYGATGAAPAPAVTLAPFPPGAPGTDETATMTIATPCNVNPALGFSVIPNACITAPLALTTNLAGTFTDTGTKVVAGKWTGASVAPLTRTAATFNQNFVFTDFAAFDRLGTRDPDGKLLVTGPVTATMKPIGGESLLNTFGGAPIYMIGTPVAAIDHVIATGVTATLVKHTGAADATTTATFKVTITASDLMAFAGAYYDGATTRTNELTGTITLDGEAVTLPLAGSLDTGLSPPPYSQAAVDASYWSNGASATCDGDLKGPVPSAP